MKVRLHGQLAKLGNEFEINTDVPADAIEGLSRQLPDWPRDMLIDAIGFDTEDKLRAPTEANEIHLMPRMFGGGGKFGKILLGAALIGVAIATGGAGLSLAGVVISQGSLFLAGAGMMLAGVSQLFLKAPTIDNGGPADPPASKYLGINENTTEIGTLMIQAWGRIKIAGHWLSLQSDSSDLVTTSFPATTS
jgi:predicted phage tail protein